MWIDAITSVLETPSVFLPHALKVYLNPKPIDSQTQKEN